MEVRLPRLLPHLRHVQPSALRHLTLIVADYDYLILKELEPLLRQCHALKTLHTSLAGSDLEALLGMLPISARLDELILTVAGCHFEDAYTWRDEEEDLGAPDCDTERDALLTVPALSRLKHLVVEKRGTRRGRKALLAVCRVRRTKLTWTTTWVFRAFQRSSVVRALLISRTFQ